MVNIEATEFPFVEQLPRVSDLPKRERTKLQRVWDRFQELAKITQEKGMLIPVALASKILDISRQRTYELIAADRLEVVDVDGHQFLTECSVLDYAKSERKAGRPVKERSAGEMWKASLEAAKETRRRK